MIKMYEARDSKDNYWYSLTDLEQMYDEEQVNYSFVHKRLVCPCCGHARLTCSINDDTAILTSMRKDHLLTCDYYGFKLNQNKVKKQLNNLQSFDHEYCLIFNNQQFPQKAIARKSIERKFSEDDILITKLFYGTVTIKSAHSKDKSKYINFSLKARKGQALTISFQAIVFTSLKNEIDFLNNNIDSDVTIAIIGSIKQTYDYYNLVIDKPNQIAIKSLFNC